MLHEAQISNCSLKREVDVLQSGISEIVQIVSEKEDTVNLEPTPKKPVRVISGKGSITIHVQGKKKQETDKQAASPLFSQVSYYMCTHTGIKRFVRDLLVCGCLRACMCVYVCMCVPVWMYVCVCERMRVCV